MLVIGHRGAKALAKENTFEALQAGIDTGAFILELDIQLTRDGVPIVLHDPSLLRTHGLRARIKNLDLAEVKKLTDDLTPVPTLEEVLKLHWGKIYLNIEVKSRGTGKAVATLLNRHFVSTPEDWDNCFISSFSVRELRDVKKVSDRANLALLHNRNPFGFIAYARQLNLMAVGFHRLYANPLAIDIAKKSDLFTYAYTVNRPKGALLLADKNIDAVVTDNPEIMIEALAKNSLLG